MYLIRTDIEITASVSAQKKKISKIGYLEGNIAGLLF